MRGAPQVGFSATIRKIKARTSLLTRFRPPTWRILETHVQYKRNPARCQFTTVLGVTKTRGCLHPDQHILNATQNSLCRAVNRRRGRCACSASNCRRRAMFSRTRSARQLSELTNQPRKCRSDTIMARILAEKTNQAVRQVIDFAGVRPLGEAQRACGGLARGAGHPAARVCRRATQWFGVLQTRRFPTHAAGYLEIQPAPHPEKTRTRTGRAQHFSALSHYRDGDS